MSSRSYSWYKTCLAKQCLHETKSPCSDSEIEFQNLKTFHLTAIISVSRSQMTPFLILKFQTMKDKNYGKSAVFLHFSPPVPPSQCWKASEEPMLHNSAAGTTTLRWGERGMDNGLNSHNILSLIVWNSQIHQENHTSQLVTQCWAL